jgi:hypothetical protein
MGHCIFSIYAPIFLQISLLISWSMNITTFRVRNVDACQLLYTLTCFELRYLRYFGLHVLLLRLLQVSSSILLPCLTAPILEANDS